MRDAMRAVLPRLAACNGMIGAPPRTDDVSSPLANPWQKAERQLTVRYDLSPAGSLQALSTSASSPTPVLSGEAQACLTKALETFSTPPTPSALRVAYTVSFF